MDMFANFPYTLIDTSSEKTIFHDLAKRNLLDAPMIRQARGTAQNFSSDIRRIVKDYRIDCVIWPGHGSAKDGAATVGIMRETGELAVPSAHRSRPLRQEVREPRRSGTGLCNISAAWGLARLAVGDRGSQPDGAGVRIPRIPRETRERALMAMFDAYIEKVSRYIDEMRSGGRRCKELDRPGSPDELREGLRVAVGPGAHPGIVLRGDTFVELGNPQAGSAPPSVDRSSLADPGRKDHPLRS
jgi:hypothetical protein